MYTLFIQLLLSIVLYSFCLVHLAFVHFIHHIFADNRGGSRKFYLVGLMGKLCAPEKI